MKSHFTSYDLMRPLRSAARHFQMNIKEDCQCKWIEIAAEKTSCKLVVYDFEDGVQLMLLKGSLPEDWELNFESKKESPFLMLFNVRGKMDLSFGGLDHDIQVSPLKTLLLAHPPKQTYSLKVYGQEESLFVLLNLERKLYIHHIECLPDEVQKEAEQIFSGHTALKIFINSNYGLEGAKMVQRMVDDEKDGLIHATYVEAKALELFSIQLRRWEIEINGQQPPQKNIRPGDVEKIILARNYLVENLQNAPTIEALAKKAGINRQKLKQGFKVVFGKTVNEYLREERLKMARQLLVQGHLSIKEISSNIGYENASYFARRFKKVYGLYPSEYVTALADSSEEE